MVLYHGTILTYAQNICNNGIDVNYKESQRKTDFGAGFYVTNNYNFAERCARTKSAFHFEDESLNSTPAIVILKYDISNERYYRKMYFQKPDKSWGQFVCYHRFPEVAYKNQLLYEHYDVVTGPVLDGQLYEFKNIIREHNYILSDEVLSQMVPFQMEHTFAIQKSFHNQDLVSCLRVIGYDII